MAPRSCVCLQWMSEWMADLCLRNVGVGRTGIFRNISIMNGYLIFRVLVWMFSKLVQFHGCLCSPVSREKYRGKEWDERKQCSVNLLWYHHHSGLLPGVLENMWAPELRQHCPFISKRNHIRSSSDVPRVTWSDFELQVQIDSGGSVMGLFIQKLPDRLCRVVWMMLGRWDSESSAALQAFYSTFIWFSW